MAKEQMLASLEAQIRKDIPRLMELREGCIIELDDIQAKMVLSNYEFENGCTHLLRNKERLWYATDKDLKHSKIIGHDIMLNDVLEWFRLNDIVVVTQCSKNESIITLFYIEYDEEGHYLYESHASWSLSSPYLKDQSEELIKFLYNLIKE